MTATTLTEASAPKLYLRMNKLLLGNVNVVPRGQSICKQVKAVGRANGNPTGMFATTAS